MTDKQTKEQREQSLKEASQMPKERGAMLKKLILISIAIILPIIVLCMPTNSFGIEGLTVIEHRLIAIFLFTALMWIFEVVPSWTTSVLTIALCLLTISDSGLGFLVSQYAGEGSNLVPHKALLASFADPTIILFIGGFILAIAATKSGLDTVLAKVMLKPFGTRPTFVLLGFLLVTGVFSMFLSNTATAAMMLTFLAPVLKSLPVNGKGRIALALAIPIGANIGGIGTPIGTPPNAIALAALKDTLGITISFGKWMAVMIPFVLVVLIFAWILLRKLYPFSVSEIRLNIQGEAKKDWKTILTYITFGVTILMWMLDSITGVNSNVVAMIPVAVFCISGIITKEDLGKLNWSVLWMVAGGFALGTALQKSGLAAHFIQAIPFDTWSPLLILIGSGLLCYFISNFISHTAAASLLMPILAVVGLKASENLGSLGGVETMLISVAMCSSLAMVLPISTPPNAIAHSTGLIEQKEMAKVGIILGVVGMILGYIVLIACSSIW